MFDCGGSNKKSKISMASTQSGCVSASVACFDAVDILHAAYCCYQLLVD